MIVILHVRNMHAWGFTFLSCSGFGRLGQPAHENIATLYKLYMVSVPATLLTKFSFSTATKLSHWSLLHGLCTTTSATPNVVFSVTCHSGFHIPKFSFFGCKFVPSKDDVL